MDVHATPHRALRRSHWSPEQLYVASNFTLPPYYTYKLHAASDIFFWQIHYTFSTSHSIAMRSLATTIVTAIVDWSVHSKMRKRQQRKEKWQAEGRAAWTARLPPARSTEKDSLDVGGGGGVDVSTQRQSPFFTKLPLEIRRLIYTYALGEERLQLEVVDEKGDEKAPFRLKCLSAQWLLTFPKSCKMAYVHTYLFFFKILRAS